MGTLAAGQVVILPFPFSDLSRSKVRPALLLAAAGASDWIACQITSNLYSDPLAVKLSSAAFFSGSLQRESYARPGKLFTANASLIAATAGALRPDVLYEVRDAVVSILRQAER